MIKKAEFLKRRRDLKKKSKEEFLSQRNVIKKEEFLSKKLTCLNVFHSNSKDVFVFWQSAGLVLEFTWIFEFFQAKHMPTSMFQGSKSSN